MEFRLFIEYSERSKQGEDFDSHNSNIITSQYRFSWYAGNMELNLGYLE